MLGIGFAATRDFVAYLRGPAACPARSTPRSNILGLDSRLLYEKSTDPFTHKSAGLLDRCQRTGLARRLAMS